MILKQNELGGCWKTGGVMFENEKKNFRTLRLLFSFAPRSYFFKSTRLPTLLYSPDLIVTNPFQ